MTSLRSLLLLFAWLLVLLPADAPASLSRTAFTPPPLPMSSAPSADLAPPAETTDAFAPLTLHIDGAYEGGEVRYGFLVRQNPWSMFDPDGLEASWIRAAEKECMEGKEMQVSARLQPAAPLVLATAGIWAAPAAYAYAAAYPGTAYATAEAVTTAGEIATGYDGPPIVPGPGDLLRAGVQAEKKAAQQIVNTVENVAGDAGRTVAAETKTAKQLGPIEWVDEAHGNPAAAAYEAGAAGHVPGKAPRLTATDAEGTIKVKYDGVDASVMVDRKRSVTTFPKTAKQMLRQSAAAAENCYSVRWEVPNEYNAKRARQMAETLGIKNVDVKVTD